MKYGEGQLRADAYTLKAQVKLRCVEENQKMQKAIRDGDQKVFLDILKHAVDYRLVPVVDPQRIYPYPQWRWAEPDPACAAGFLREIARKHGFAL